MIRIFAIVAVVVVTAGVIGTTALVYLDRSAAADPYSHCRQSKVASGASAIGGDITMVNHLGQTVSSAEVFTKPSLVYFGYTFCPDVCPMDNARNVGAIELLEAQGVDVTPVFITIDPERDTPEVMSDYVSAMHPRMIGLTGDMAQVKLASQTYKTYFRKNGDGEDYLVDHSTFTYLVMPQTGFVEFFRRDLTPEDLAKTISCFAEV